MSNKIYTSVPVPKFPTNVFSLSRPVVGSLRMQRCYPTEILEVIPGDAMNFRHETFLRTAPLVAPPLAKVTLSHHAFFIPAWQLHEKFDDFITGGEKMDFSDHLPYTWVGDIYQWIDGILSSLVSMLDDVDEFIASANYLHTSQVMEDIVSVIEAFDYSRAIPFGLPEFQPIQAETSEGTLLTLDNLTIADYTDETVAVQKMWDIADGNWKAWRQFNPQFLSTLQLRVNLLPFFAQLKVWSEYFRDENLVDDYWDELKDSSLFSAVDYQDFSWSAYDQTGVDPSDWSEDDVDTWKNIVQIFGIKKRAWKKDRFTSALPWTQKGPDVTIPLAGSLPLAVDTSSVVPGSNSNLQIFGSSSPNKGSLFVYSDSSNKSVKLTGSADLSKSTGLATMRDLRRAEAVEEFAEADGRFGNRYPENTLGQFGVYTPDSRLPRAEFLGSTRQILSFGEIAQTSETANTPLGTLAGKGTSYNPSFLFRRRFTMHGFVVIFTSIQVSAMYEQGIHPMFSRFDRTEYAWPRYARLGEEPIYAKELSIFGENVTDEAVFGYAPRYSTYKSDTGSIHGQMKTTLNYWTFSRKFPIDQDPHLNEEFIYNDPRKDAFALQNPFAENFYFEIDWKCRASRKLPFFGVPSI